MAKEARLRPQAEVDLVDAAQYYAQEGGTELAERMFDAALAALQPIEREPAMGLPRLGQLSEIPGLRSWRVTDFPLQWLYFEAANHLDVVRLLGDRQDIVAILTKSD
jgi:toxin ParE1/3/4